MDDLLKEFLTETNESLDVVDNQLVRFEQEPNNAKILDNIFRLVHTIKGTCGFLDLPRLETLAHAAETLMGKFRDGMPATGEAVTLILTTIDRIKDRLYIDLTGPYWPPERVHVDAGYKTLPFPFVEMAAPSFAMEAQWTVDHLLAYFRSWSATQRYLRANGQDPVALIEPDLRAAWGEANPRRTVRWQFHLRCGKAT